jgi:hypothetical protein
VRLADVQRASRARRLQHRVAAHLEDLAGERAHLVFVFHDQDDDGSGGVSHSAAGAGARGSGWPLSGTMRVRVGLVYS